MEKVGIVPGQSVEEVLSPHYCCWSSLLAAAALGRGIIGLLRGCTGVEVQVVDRVQLVVDLPVEEVGLAGGQLVVDVGLVHDEEPCVEKFRVVENNSLEKLELENI